MKYALIGLLVVIVAIGGYFLLKTDNSIDERDMQQATEQPQENDTAMNETFSVDPISHATMVIEFAGMTIYNDPVGGAEPFAGRAPADIILVSDVHGDHLNAETLEAVMEEETLLVVPQAVADALPENLSNRAIILSNGERYEAGSITIEAVPMYNLPGGGEIRHEKGRGNGYLLEAEGERIYIAGDTAGIPEMRSLTDIDIAFVPMNLPYTMDVNEAADAVLEFAPKRVYPYHYRGQDGLSDVEEFRDLVRAGNPAIEVMLLNWYPEQ